MAGIPSNGRIFFTTASAVPSGWTHDTNFNLKFLQGSTSAGTNGGAATHIHTADAHTHIQDQHRHTTTVGGGPGAPTVKGALAKSGAVAVASNIHTHASGNGEYTTATNQDTTITISTGSMLPECLFTGILGPDSPDTELPADGIVLAEDDLTDADWKFSDGNNSTTDLREKYMVGYFAAFGTAIGTPTHTHTSTTHNHTQDSHTHADSHEGAISDFGTLVASGSAKTASQASLHHDFTNIQTVAATNQTATVTINSAANDPAYVYLAPHQNKSGTTQPVKVGMIIGWVGTDENIPGEWVLCNGNKGTVDLTTRQIKCTATQGDIGTTGGSNLHTHTTVAHTHVQDAHGHTFTFAVGHTQGINTNFFGVTVPTSTHNHSTRTYENATATNQNATVTMSSDDGRYSYREIMFIKYNPPTVWIKGAQILGANIL